MPLSFYPLQGFIRLQIDNIPTWRGPRFSYFLKLGGYQWYLQAREECSERTGNEKWVSIHLTCLPVIGKGAVIKVNHPFSLINQSGGDDKVMGCESNFTRSHGSWGHPNFIKWAELEAGGYVKEGSIVFECSFLIESEKGGRADFGEERPNEQDLRAMLERKVERRVERFEEVVEVSEVSESRDCFTRTRSLFELPVKLSIRRRSNWLEVTFHFNSEDVSDWWMSRVSVEIRIISDGDSCVSQSFTHLFRRSDASYAQLMCEWDELVDQYVRDGKFNVEVFVSVLESFDKEPEKGVERPRRKMTDVVLLVDGERLNVCKTLLAQQSAHFRELFASDPEQTEFEIENVTSEGFIRFLELVHNEDMDVLEEEREGVLETIERFGAPECFERFEAVLRKRQFENTRRKIRELESTCSSIDFRQKSDLTDAEIIVDGHSYYVSQQILANASVFFMKRFYDPYSEDGSTISDLLVCPELLEMLLEHIYQPTRPVKNATFRALIHLAHLFSVPRLLEKCEEYNLFYSPE